MVKLAHNLWQSKGDYSEDYKAKDNEVERRVGHDVDGGVRSTHGCRVREARHRSTWFVRGLLTEPRATAVCRGLTESFATELRVDRLSEQLSDQLSDQRWRFLWRQCADQRCFVLLEGAEWLRGSWNVRLYHYHDHIIAHWLRFPLSGGESGGCFL
eukprot:scaffold24572_cov65-Phaeocystis_antarctica.AAC.2